jgi:hypothetical protein
MVEYILEYQNNFCYSTLFLNNFVTMLEKGCRCSELLSSDIFNYEFDFDQWPGTNSNTTKMIHPFSQSIFKLRDSYSVIFDKIWRKDEAMEVKKMEGKYALKR